MLFWCLENLDLWDLKKFTLCLFWFVFVVLFIGLFAAAQDRKIEWVIVKGISHFSNDGNAPNDFCKSFASIMAASLVSNMLNDPVVFKEWPHYEGISPLFVVCLLVVNFLLRYIYVFVEKGCSFSEKVYKVHGPPQTCIDLMCYNNIVLISSPPQFPVYINSTAQQYVRHLKFSENSLWNSLILVRENCEKIKKNVLWPSLLSFREQNSSTL